MSVRREEQGTTRGAWAAVASALLALAACHGGSRSSDFLTSPFCTTPGGAPSQSRLQPGVLDLHGVRLIVEEIPPRVPGRAFTVRVEGESVRRRIGATGAVCGPRPDPADPCAMVAIPDLAEDLHLRILDAGLASANASIHGVDTWDYAELDRALVVVADALRAWRIADPLRLELRPPHCAVAQ
jgi:hypothetical protein